MPLFIRDQDVDDLAVQYQKATGAKTKTDAVKRALSAGLEAIKVKEPIADRFAVLQEKADALGPVDPNFDQAAYADEIWDER